MSNWATVFEWATFVLHDDAIVVVLLLCTAFESNKSVCTACLNGPGYLECCAGVQGSKPAAVRYIVL